MRENLEQAKIFFGGFEGDHKTFQSWKEKYQNDQRRFQKEAQTRLMRDVGGTGKYNATPPTDYCPSLDNFKFTSQNNCEKCNLNFADEKTTKAHIREVHKKETQKVFVSDALLYIEADAEFHRWLNRPTEVSNSKELNDERVLLKRTIAENKNIYKKVGEKNGVIETRSEILTEDDGKVRKTVLKQHFVDVTKRKFTEVESEKSIDQKKAKVSTKRESETVETVLDHLTGKYEEKKASLVAKVVDNMGSDFAKSVINKSKVLKEKNKFSPLETAAIIAGSNSPDVLLDHLITAGNNKHGSSPFASRRQVLKARNEKLVISKDDWEASYENLYKNKQGK